MSMALWLALLALQRPVQAVNPKLGEPAPALAVAELLQASEGSSATWQALRGKAVVLEFWATWCGGCVDNIPHLNTLAEKFRDRPIQFISITDEEKAIVTHFLQKRPIAGWVALDAEDRTFENYGVEGRPQTILVDAHGVLRAITTPDSVNDGVLEDLLAGKVLNFVQPTGSPFIGTEQSAPAPLMEVLIRPAAPVAMTGMSSGAERLMGGRHEWWGVTLRDLLSDAYGIPSERIEAPEWCSQTKYDLAVVTPRGGKAEQEPLVRQVLASAFRLKLRHDMRETDVYLLRRLPDREPNLRLATTKGRSGRWDRGGELEAIGVGVERLVQVGQSVLGRPIFDETGLNQRYDFDLDWNGKDPSSFTKAVREQLGLELVPTRKPLEHLVVESAKEPSTW